MFLWVIETKDQEIRAVRGDYDRVLSHGCVLRVSIAAGIGDELFFRAFLQSVLGVFPASAVFGLFKGGAMGWRTVVGCFIQGLLLGPIMDVCGLLPAIAIRTLFAYSAMCDEQVRHIRDVPSARTQAREGGAE